MSCRDDKLVRYKRSPTPVDVPPPLLPHLDLHCPGLGPVLCADSTANFRDSVEEFLCRLTTAVAEVVTGTTGADPASTPGEAGEAGAEDGEEEECGHSRRPHNSHRHHVLLPTELNHDWTGLSRLVRIYTSS